MELEGEDADDEMADQEANVDGNQSNSTASAFLGFLNDKYRGKVPNSASINEIFCTAFTNFPHNIV